MDGRSFGQDVFSVNGIENEDPRHFHDRERDKMESEPGTFSSLTYSTSRIRHIIQRLHGTFTRRCETPVFFFSEGIKGSGKSYLLVLMNHLLCCSAEAQWF